MHFCIVIIIYILYNMAIMIAKNKSMGGCMNERMTISCELKRENKTKTKKQSLRDVGEILTEILALGVCARALFSSICAGSCPKNPYRPPFRFL